MTHAGFWVDGAVRKPEERHFDGDELIHAKWKKEYPDFDLVTAQFAYFNEVYWLDTTPRESLTPEELFSVVRLLWPKCENVFDPGVNTSIAWQVQLDDKNEHTPIAWGNLRQYPPPTELQWLRVTRDNVDQFMFRECRMMVNDLTYSGNVAGWDDEDSVCLVSCTYDAACNVTKWDIVEVQA